MAKALRITLLLVLVHMVLGNIAGWLLSHSLITSVVLEIAFLPYTFVWALSSLVGWDGWSFVIMLFGSVIVALLFYPIGRYLANRK